MSKQCAELKENYEAQSLDLNTWNYHVHFSVVSVDHKQQLRADRSERWTYVIPRI